MRAWSWLFVVGCGASTSTPAVTPGGFVEAPAASAPEAAAATPRLVGATHRLGEPVAVVLSGTIMLTGACSGETPLVEVTRLASDGKTWTTVSQAVPQLDCGASAADWHDHRVDVPWPPLTEALTPGTYRLVFHRRIGDAWERVETSSFELST